MSSVYSPVAWACVASASGAADADLASVAMASTELRDAVRAARRLRGEWRVRGLHLACVDAASAARLVVWQPSRARHAARDWDAPLPGLGAGAAGSASWPASWPALWDLRLVTTRVEPGFWEHVFDACPRLRAVTLDAEYPDGIDRLVRLGCPRLQRVCVRQTSPCAFVPDQPLGVVVSETLLEYDNTVLAVAVHAPRLTSLRVRDHAGARVLDACVVPALVALDWTCPWDRLVGWAPPPSARRVRLTVSALYAMSDVQAVVDSIASFLGGVESLDVTLESLDVTLDLRGVFDRFSRVTWPRDVLPSAGTTIRATFAPRGFETSAPAGWDLRFQEPITAELQRALDDLRAEGACSDDDDVLDLEAQIRDM
jgi:hypothetical protein